VRDLGLGVMIEREGLTAEDLRQVARRAASDPGIRSEVRAMQQTIRESGGVDLAARALIRFMEDGV
jgi:UDP:flavonoid glycosyltransferase YjiC (YdhE family)